MSKHERKLRIVPGSDVRYDGVFYTYDPLDFALLDGWVFGGDMFHKTGEPMPLTADQLRDKYGA